MIAVDSSVAVPAIIGWHEFHEAAAEAAVGASIPAHALLETYSVLTRMPGRLAPADVGAVLSGRFPDELILPAGPGLARSTAAKAAEVGLHGGAVYDALIGWTAVEHGAVLVTLDARAASTYERAGVEAHYLSV